MDNTIALAEIIRLFEKESKQVKQEFMKESYEKLEMKMECLALSDKCKNSIHQLVDILLNDLWRKKMRKDKWNMYRILVTFANNDDDVNGFAYDVALMLKKNLLENPEGNFTNQLVGTDFGNLKVKVEEPDQDSTEVVMQPPVVASDNDNQQSQSSAQPNDKGKILKKKMSPDKHRHQKTSTSKRPSVTKQTSDNMENRDETEEINRDSSDSSPAESSDENEQLSSPSKSNDETILIPAINPNLSQLTTIVVPVCEQNTNKEVIIPQSANPRKKVIWKKLPRHPTHCLVKGCGKSFDDFYRRIREDHYKKDHPKSKKWRCYICSNRFGSSDKLEKHYFAIHHRRYQCAYCSFTGKTPTQVWKHYQVRHKVNSEPVDIHGDNNTSNHDTDEDGGGLSDPSLNSEANSQPINDGSTNVLHSQVTRNDDQDKGPVVGQQQPSTCAKALSTSPEPRNNEDDTQVDVTGQGQSSAHQEIQMSARINQRDEHEQLHCAILPVNNFEQPILNKKKRKRVLVSSESEEECHQVDVPGQGSSVKKAKTDLAKKEEKRPEKQKPDFEKAKATIQSIDQDNAVVPSPADDHKVNQQAFSSQSNGQTLLPPEYQNQTPQLVTQLFVCEQNANKSTVIQEPANTEKKLDIVVTNPQDSAEEGHLASSEANFQPIEQGSTNVIQSLVKESSNDHPNYSNKGPIVVAQKAPISETEPKTIKGTSPEPRTNENQIEDDHPMSEELTNEKIQSTISSSSDVDQFPGANSDDDDHKLHQSTSQSNDKAMIEVENQQNLPQPILAPNHDQSAGVEPQANTAKKVIWKTADIQQQFTALVMKPQPVMFIKLGVKCFKLDCQQIFPNEEQLNDHMWSEYHIRAVPCLVRNCGKSFRNIRSREDHFKKDHRGGKEWWVRTGETWQCTKCTKRFNSHASLVGHYNTEHHNQYQCAFGNCQFTSGQHSIVYNHYIGEHKKACKYYCCGLVFNNPANLAQHERDNHAIKP